MSTAIIERTFNAPQSAVWKAWSNPEVMKQWWGPKQFTCPSATIDFTVGGKYLFAMRDQDGKDYWSTGTYKEIDPMSKIVCTDSFSDEQGNIVSPVMFGLPEGTPSEFKVTIELKEIDGKTHMTLTHKGMPAGPMTEDMTKGWNEQFDKLVEVLK